MSALNNNLFFGANPDKFKYARQLRKTSTIEEGIMWDLLRNRRFDNYKFRRQHPIGYYIADFYCSELSLIIEIDGEYHDSEYQKQYDEFRTKLFLENNLKIIRFTNSQVADNIDDVFNQLREFIKLI